LPNSNRKIRITASAERDLKKIGDYTQKEWGRKQKAKYLSGIRNKFSELNDMPDIGKERDNLRKGLRSHPVGSHVIFYESTSKRLTIMRILHKNMEPERYLNMDRGRGLSR